MKNVLVIGSEGNIGQPLVKHLNGHGYKVFEVDQKPAWRKNYLMCDIRNPLDLLDILGQEDIDVVVNLAAMVSRVTCEQAASLAVDVNLHGLQNVLTLTKKLGAKLVHFSTSEVYGPTIDFMVEDGQAFPNNRYGLTKLLGESLVTYEMEHNGLDAVILRPFMMYDENEGTGDHRSAIIRFAHNLLLGMPIDVHTNTSRAWFHVDDAVRAIRSAIDTQERLVFNIGSDDVRSMESVAELIRLETKASQSLINFVPQPDRMTPAKVASFQRQKEILGVTPEVSIEDGVARVVSMLKKRLQI